MGTSWKIVYKQRRERRASSSTVSAGAGSTPSPPHSLRPLDDMRHILAPEPDYGAETAQLEMSMGGIWDFMNQVSTDGANEFPKTSHLKIMIDSSDFGDWEDDSWCLFLATFKPLSQKVTHLSIHIKGNFVFTRYNYVKPEMSVQEEVLAVKGKGKGLDLDLGPYNAAPVSNNENKAGPSQKPKFTRSSMNSTANADWMPASLNTPAADPTNKGPSYINKKVPSRYINLHIYEKAIVPALIDCFKVRTSPLAFITIQGPMELSLRRHIISSLSPSFMSSLILLAEAGYSLNDSAQTTQVQAWEASTPELVFLKKGIQDPDDFGQWEKEGMENVNMHSLGEWVVPSGKGAREVWGWRVGGPGVKVWRGPSGGWHGRDGI